MQKKLKIFQAGDSKTGIWIQSTPVVLLISTKEYSGFRKCYHGGDKSYIVKPVNFERVEEAIRNPGSYRLLLNQPPI